MQDCTDTGRRTLADLAHHPVPAVALEVEEARAERGERREFLAWLLAEELIALLRDGAGPEATGRALSAAARLLADVGEREGWSPARERIAAATRALVLRRDAYRCVECGSVDDLVMDHRVPVRLGGGSDADNLRALCARCNGRKGARL